MANPYLEKLSQHVKRILAAFRQGTDDPPRHPPPIMDDQPEDKAGSATAAEANADPRLYLEAQCHRLAFQAARKSWELVPDEPTQKALEAKGVALAQSMHRPHSERNDQRKLEKFKGLHDERTKRIAGRDRAKAVSQARDQDLAALGAGRRYPSIPTILRHAATLGLAISIAPTLRDLFVGLDPFMKWLAGGACAWGVSLLIIQGMLPIEASPQQPREEAHQS